MNFITFPVSTTNIFPMANSVSGGQYATEFNLRTRESICTPQNVTYMIGPSYAHGEDDFKVTLGQGASRSMLSIAPGRAIINGHFVQNLAEMQIDMAAARAMDPSLVGKLCVGIRAMYSTLPTMAGTIEVEDADSMYEGVQLVVLPEASFKLPADVPTDETQVTAHLKLAEFTYRNGRISELVNNYPGKCQAFESIRVAGQDDQLDGRYLSKAGLNGRNLYVFSGKGTDVDSQGVRHDTWCIAQNTLIIWDANTQFGHAAHNDNEEAQFIADPSTGKINLYMPHKQLDYDITDTHGNLLYYQPKVISLPGANYSTGAPGTVTPEYTQSIKDALVQLGRYQHLPSGEQITYIDELHDRSDLPVIKPEYSPGDFVLVGHDYTVAADSTVQPPATMYVIQYGLVTNLRYVLSTYDTDAVPGECSGLELANVSFDTSDVIHDPVEGAANSMWRINNGGEYYGSAGRHDYLVAKTSRQAGYQTPVGYSIYGSSDIVDADGVLLVDATELNYYLVTTTSGLAWTDPIWLTASIPLATEEAVGGFLNVPSTALDGGYVYRDDTGHLKLLDYDLLRTGTLAYRISDDVSITGLTMSALQAELDDRVNERVAFPNQEHIQSQAALGLDPNVINLTIELEDDETASVVYIRGIDSRFGASIYLHITGHATSATTLVLMDCEKIRIDNNIYGSPTIVLRNCGLFYDSTVLDNISTVLGLKLWYGAMDITERLPDISIDGLTVMARSPQVIPEEIDFWSVLDPNDNHYEYALRSITFDNLGEIVGASIMIRNNSSYNVDPGTSIYVTDFRLPQGLHLTYPRSKLAKQIKIDGTFVSAYWSNPDSEYIITTTSFTAVSQTYDSVLTESGVSYTENLGTLSLLSNTIVTTNVSGLINGTAFTPGSDIDGWVPDSFHVFDGGVVS